MAIVSVASILEGHREIIASMSLRGRVSYMRILKNRIGGPCVCEAINTLWPNLVYGTEPPKVIPMKDKTKKARATDTKLREIMSRRCVRKMVCGSCPKHR